LKKLYKVILLIQKANLIVNKIVLDKDDMRFLELNISRRF